MDSLYETDFYTWATRQGALLRSGQAHRADLANIAEEIETWGRSEAAALESAYRLISLHLLKAIYQATRATRSWKATIVRERLAAKRIIRTNPGLTPRRAELFASGYADARKEAAAETGVPLASFPVEPAFSLEQAEDEAFMPKSFPAVTQTKRASSGNRPESKEP